MRKEEVRTFKYINVVNQYNEYCRFRPQFELLVFNSPKILGTGRKVTRVGNSLFLTFALRSFAIFTL